MKKPAFLYALCASVVFCALLALTAVYTNAAQPASAIESLQVKNGIQVVFQIDDDDKTKGLAKSLVTLQRLLDVYKKEGVDLKSAKISAVFHGKAGQFLLKDKAYQTHNEVTEPNPNKAMISDFIKTGVSVELCNHTLTSNEWKPEDVLPNVKVVIGAIPRVIDLQMQGYKYVKF